MKKLFLLLIGFAALLNLQAQTAKTMMWDGSERQYLEYVPTGHDGQAPEALVLLLHGLGNDMNNMFLETQFKDIADFIKNEGGVHDWYYTPDYDIDYTNEIYKFFASCMIPAAVSEQEAPRVEVYPNPTADILYVQMEEQNNLTSSTLRLFDAFGRLMLERRGLKPTTQLNLTGFPAGIYLVQLYKDNQLIGNVKVVKK